MKAPLQFQKGSTPVPAFKPARNSLLQRACRDTPGLEGNDIVHGRENLIVQRSLANLARTSIAPPIVHGVLRSPGQPLDQATRTFMEPRFGHDFSKVRVHTDARAAESAHAVNALAYTVGHNIVFGRGQYTPNTTAGQRLLAHELTHTVQQGNNETALQSRLEVGAADDAFEREADNVAAQVLVEPSSARGVSPSIRPASGGLAQAGRIQRTIGDGHDLQSPRFAGDPVLEACFDNKDLLRVGRRGEAVKKIQQALIDAAALDGAENPLLRFGVDGNFEHETEEAVKKYQRKHGLDPDGIVGPHTMGSLDALFAGPVPPTPKKTVPVVITGNTELWHFNGELPSLYPLKQTLTANAGSIPGTFRWSIAGGDTFADFSGSPTAVGPNAILKSKLGSRNLNDVQVKVDFAGTGGEIGTAQMSFTVRRPDTLSFIKNDDHDDPTFVYETKIHKKVVDQFNTDLPRGVEVNEQFTASPTADFPGMNWRRGPNGGGFVRPPDWFFDQVQGETPDHTPAPVKPTDPSANIKVYHWPGTWHVGSSVIGRGQLVATVTWQKYRGKARHE